MSEGLCVHTVAAAAAGRATKEQRTWPSPVSICWQQLAVLWGLQGNTSMAGILVCTWW